MLDENFFTEYLECNMKAIYSYFVNDIKNLKTFETLSEEIIKKSLITIIYFYKKTGSITYEKTIEIILIITTGLIKQEKENGNKNIDYNKLYTHISNNTNSIFEMLNYRDIEFFKYSNTSVEINLKDIINSFDITKLRQRPIISDYIYNYNIPFINKKTNKITFIKIINNIENDLYINYDLFLLKYAANNIFKEKVIKNYDVIIYDIKNFKRIELNTKNIKENIVESELYKMFTIIELKLCMKNYKHNCLTCKQVKKCKGDENKDHVNRFKQIEEDTFKVVM